MKYASVSEMLQAIRDAVQLANGGVKVTNADRLRTQHIDRLVHTAVFGDERDRCRRSLDHLEGGLGSRRQVGLDRRPVPGPRARRVRRDHRPGRQRARHGLRHRARARSRRQGEELRRLHLRACALARWATPSRTCDEFATVVTAASIREGHVGPIFIQGDHYQANAKKYGDRSPRRRSKACAS